MSWKRPIRLIAGNGTPRRYYYGTFTSGVLVLVACMHRRLRMWSHHCYLIPDQIVAAGLQPLLPVPWNAGKIVQVSTARSLLYCVRHTVRIRSGA